MKPRSAVSLSCGMALLVTAVAGSAQGDRPAITHHFGAAMAVHDALVRGDAEGARKQARVFAEALEAENVPASGMAHVATMKQAAADIGAAAGLADMTSPSASMLAACGDCHRGAGAMPAIRGSGPSTLGGVVGHMLAHQHAADLLVQGLTVPSASSWREGAQALRSAPLHRNQMPRDPKLTADILASEKRVHDLAGRAVAAADMRARVGVYGELLANCGSCHALHGNIWGPQGR